MADAKEIDWKTLIEELKQQWGSMWRERLEDKLRAEGIATKDYPQLFVEQGLVVVASRDFKPLTFREIVRQHIPEADRYIPPNPLVGGWGKFIRDSLPKLKHDISSRRGRFAPEKPDKNKCGALKKGGRGWLHK